MLKGAMLWLIGIPVVAILWLAVRVGPDFMWGALTGAFGAAALIIGTGIAARAAAQRALERDRSLDLGRR